MKLRKMGKVCVCVRGVTSFLAAAMLSLSANALEVYQISGDVTGGVDLLGMSETYRTDSIQWGTANAILSGTVTHAPATVESPFVIIGSNSGKFRHDTGLDTIPLRISMENASAKITHEMQANVGGVYTNAPGFGHLDIVRGKFAVSVYRQWGDAGGSRVFSLTNGCALSAWNAHIGNGSCSGVLELD